MPKPATSGMGQRSSRRGCSPALFSLILVTGDSNKMIANHLRITEATVKVHLKSLLRKINATNRTQAAIWALNNGIGGRMPEDVDDQIDQVSAQ